MNIEVRRVEGDIFSIGFQQKHETYTFWFELLRCENAKEVLETFNFIHGGDIILRQYR